MDKHMNDFLTVGDALPDFSLPGLDGETINLGDFDSRKLILFMWASW